MIRKTIKIAPVLFAFVVLNSGLTPAAHAQSSDQVNAEGEVVLRESDYGDFGLALQRETTSYSSKDALDKIPPHSLYHTIFVMILNNETSYQSVLSEDDWNLIHSLPSHQDRSILEPVIASMKSTCFALHEDNAMNLSFEQSLELYAETTRNSDVALDNHYTQSYERLSESGKQVFNSIKEGFRGTNSLAFSTTDFAAAAKDFPVIAKATMAARCEDINQTDINGLSEGRTLKDDIEVRQWGG